MKSTLRSGLAALLAIAAASLMSVSAMAQPAESPVSHAASTSRDIHPVHLGAAGQDMTVAKKAKAKKDKRAEMAAPEVMLASLDASSKPAPGAKKPAPKKPAPKKKIDMAAGPGDDGEDSGGTPASIRLLRT